MYYFMKPKSIVGAALVGMLLISSCASTKKDIKPESGVAEKEVKPPSLKNAEVKSIWVPDKIDGNRWEAAHYLYVIDKPSTWRVNQ